MVDIEASLNCIKNGKASGPDGLTKENMIYAHPSIIIHLKLLFNPLMHEVAVLFQICSEVMSSLGNHSSWLHSFK